MGQDMQPLTAPLLRFHFLDMNDTLPGEADQLSERQSNYQQVLETVDAYTSYIFFIYDSIKYFLPCTTSKWEQATGLLQQRLNTCIDKENTLLTKADGKRNNCYLIARNKTHDQAQKMLTNLIRYRSQEIPSEDNGFDALENLPLLDSRRLSWFNNKENIPQSMLKNRPQHLWSDMTHYALNMIYS